MIRVGANSNLVSSNFGLIKFSPFSLSVPKLVLKECFVKAAEAGQFVPDKPAVDEMASAEPMQFGIAVRRVLRCWSPDLHWVSLSLFTN